MTNPAPNLSLFDSSPALQLVTEIALTGNISSKTRARIGKAQVLEFQEVHDFFVPLSTKKYGLRPNGRALLANALLTLTTASAKVLTR